MVILVPVPLRSIYHARTFIPRQNRPSIDMVLDNNLELQRFSHN